MNSSSGQFLPRLMAGCVLAFGVISTLLAAIAEHLLAVGGHQSLGFRFWESAFSILVPYVICCVCACAVRNRTIEFWVVAVSCGIVLILGLIPIVSSISWLWAAYSPPGPDDNHMVNPAIASWIVVYLQLIPTVVAGMAALKSWGAYLEPNA
jgi:multisubunit Na+/H+ antiporter MnhB subunit